MIYFILIAIAILYLIFLLSGNNYSLVTNKKFQIIILFLFISLVIVFLNLSGIKDYEEYNKILNEHETIRYNIITIKKNIPILELKLEKNPKYYEGWVMLAKSYLITNNFLLSSNAYDKAISLKSDDKLVIVEYIATLRKLNAKENKIKIISLFNQLLQLDKNNLDAYNEILNYSIEINDSKLTKSTLENVINNPNIDNKEQYIRAYNKIVGQINDFRLKIDISDDIMIELNDYKNIYFILGTDDGIPFAVKRLKSNGLTNLIQLDGTNIMLKNKKLPTDVNFYIKASDSATIDDSLKLIYRYNSINLRSMSTLSVN